MALEKKQRKRSVVVVVVVDGGGDDAAAAGAGDESEDGNGDGASPASPKDANLTPGERRIAQQKASTHWEHCRREDRATVEDIPVPGHRKWREAPGTCAPHWTKQTKSEYRDSQARSDRTKRGFEVAAQTHECQVLNDL
jgi:hypothetical protein